VEDRLTDLELRYMLQERAIEELNDTVYCQEQVISKLEREVGQIREHLRLMLPSMIGSISDEPLPPHY
jgi:SlyX protein